MDKDWSIPDEHLQKARMLRDQLLQTSEANVLLHGDLHHDHLSQNGENWLVIDPKGMVGEPAYGSGNFYPQSDTRITESYKRATYYS